MAQDFYETLQVHPRADKEAINAAYQRLRALYDPVRLEGAAEELVELARTKRDSIERAYATLSDPTRRATYDAETALAPKIAPRPVPARARPVVEVDDEDEDEDDAPPEPALDYRPLPPARRAERKREFNAQPIKNPTSRRNRDDWKVPAILSGVLAVAAVVLSLALTGFGSAPTAAVVAAPTAAPVDQFEAAITNLQQATEQSPNDPQTWVQYGNALYDSAVIAREQDATGALYQQRMPRWLQAADAYRKALALDPANAEVRSDLGASSCFYGAGTGDQATVREGLAEVQKAQQLATDNTRVMLNLGNCMVSLQPAQTTEAVAMWKQIVAQAPSTDPVVAQARLLIERYERQ